MVPGAWIISVHMRGSFHSTIRPARDRRRARDATRETESAARGARSAGLSRIIFKQNSLARRLVCVANPSNYRIHTHPRPTQIQKYRSRPPRDRIASGGRRIVIRPAPAVSGKLYCLTDISPFRPPRPALILCSANAGGRRGSVPLRTPHSHCRRVAGRLVPFACGRPARRGSFAPRRLRLLLSGLHSSPKLLT